MRLDVAEYSTRETGGESRDEKRGWWRQKRRRILGDARDSYDDSRTDTEFCRSRRAGIIRFSVGTRPPSRVARHPRRARSLAHYFTNFRWSVEVWSVRGGYKLEGSSRGWKKIYAGEWRIEIIKVCVRIEKRSFWEKTFLSVTFRRVFYIQPRVETNWLDFHIEIRSHFGTPSSIIKKKKKGGDWSVWKAREFHAYASAEDRSTLERVTEISNPTAIELKRR